MPIVIITPNLFVVFSFMTLFKYTPAEHFHVDAMTDYENFSPLFIYCCKDYFQDKTLSMRT